MTFQEKLDLVNAAVAQTVAQLGLKFVDGPGPDSSVQPQFSMTTVNGQDRGELLMALAETA